MVKMVFIAGTTLLESACAQDVGILTRPCVANSIAMRKIAKVSINGISFRVRSREGVSMLSHFCSSRKATVSMFLCNVAKWRSLRPSLV